MTANRRAEPEKSEADSNRLTRLKKVIEHLTVKFKDIMQQMKQILTVLVNIKAKCHDATNPICSASSNTWNIVIER